MTLFGRFKETRRESDQERIAPFVERYGELIFDIAWSVTEDIHLTQIVFRNTFRKLLKQRSSHSFEHYERPYIMRIAVNEILRVAGRATRPELQELRFTLDARATADERLGELGFFLRRLGVEDRVLILLREKYGFSYAEIAAVMSIPEDSARLRRLQSIKLLASWVWENA